MRRPVVLASLAAVALASLPAAAQDSPSNQLHYPLADELAGMLRGADAKRAAGELDAAIDIYRLVLDSDKVGRAGYQLATIDEPVRGAVMPGAPRPRRYIGITEWAIASLRALPPEGLKLFRSRYDYRAGSAVAEAKAARDPYTALARVYELYPVSSHAPRILESMADLALERGELERATQSLERLLAHHTADLQDPTRIRRKLLVCALGLGRPDKARALAVELARDDPRGKVHLGAGPVSEEELVKLATQAESRRLGKAEGTRPALDLVRVDPENRAAVDVKATVGPARFAPRTFEQNATLSGPNRFAPGQASQTPATSRNLPLLHDGHVFMATADQVLAYDVNTGDDGPRIPRIGPTFPDPNSKIQFGGAIDQETLVLPLVDEVLRDQQYRGIPIKVKIPIRKLAGFDLPNWRWSWNHARMLDGTPLERWSFPSPPIAVEGVVFAPAFSIEGFVNCHVGAFDVHTGEKLWDSWIVSGQVEQTMFGEQATEPLCAPVAVSNGVVYYSTSFGCVAALDANTGRPLWVTEYEQIEVRAPRGYYADPRTIGWENNAPIVEAGVVVVAPLDSPKYLGLDARTGERLWANGQRQTAVEGEMRYLLGSCTIGGQGMVILGGGGQVRCLAVRGGKLLWTAQLRGRVVAGRGCIARSATNEDELVVLVPVDRNEVFTIQVETGKQSGNFNVGTTGNIVLCGEHALVTGNGVLAVHRLGGAAAPANAPAAPRGRDF
jgi:outer membrane protein assembly factor BamB